MRCAEAACGILPRGGPAGGWHGSACGTRRKLDNGCNHRYPYGLPSFEQDCPRALGPAGRLSR